MSKKMITVTILIILISIIFSSFSAFAQPPHGSGGDEEKTETISFNGYCDNPQVDQSGSSWEQTVELQEGRIINIEFVLSWQDDEGSDSDPDTFSLTMDDGEQQPRGDSASDNTVTVTWDEENLNNAWNVMVSCDSAGSTQVPLGLLGLRTTEEQDPGNSWTLDIIYTYSELTGDMGGMPANVRAVYSSPIFWIHVGLMISSTYLFLFTFIFAGIFLYTRNRWNYSQSSFQRYLAKPNLFIILLIIAFLAFFLASVPIGMWVAGMMYGATKAWTGFPALWNPEAFEFTNADNVSFAVLLLWAIPIYFNRRQIMQSKWFKKLFGWSKFIMARAEKAPEPKLMMKELALCYFFMGFLVYLVFMVQPHGGGS